MSEIIKQYKKDFDIPLQILKKGEEANIPIKYVTFDEKGNISIYPEFRITNKYTGIKIINLGEGRYEISNEFGLGGHFATNSKKDNNNKQIKLEKDSKYETEIEKVDNENGTYYLPSPKKNLESKILPKKSQEFVEEKVKPLYDIFMNPEVLNQVLINTGVPEIVRGEKPIFTGTILHGVGGTGKTSLQKAIAQVYKNCGAISEELHVAQMSEKYIGSLGNNLDKKIAEINEKSEKEKVPAFIFLDEATSLVMSKESHNTSGADYYQEAVDVLKKYISNYPNLIFSITTNAMPDVYDDTLIREGRLTPILIPLPRKEEKTKMWEFFLKKHGIFEDLEYDKYEKLADLTIGVKGSFISEFARGYLPGKKLEEETKNAGSKSILDALVKGSQVNLKTIKDGLTFEKLFKDVKKEIGKNETRKPKKNVLGFGFVQNKSRKEDKRELDLVAMKK